jgi:hypothetical protein
MRRTRVHLVAVLVTIAVLGAGCGSDDNDASPGGDQPDGATTTTIADPASLEVDRTSRFSQLDTFCEPTNEAPSETPTASADGITADSVSITHMRVTLEDLEGIGFAIPIGDPADQARRFVDILNNRCGGVNGRKLDLTLVETPPLTPAGQDPAAVAQGACIEATEDNQAVFAFSGSGWGGQGGASCLTSGDHDTVYLTTYNITAEDLEGAENRLYSLAISSVDGLEYLARTLQADGALDGKTIGVVMQDSPGDPEIVEQGLLDTLDELGVDVAVTNTLQCAGGNSCPNGVADSVREMKDAGVNVIFPLLNVINLPAYIEEMVTQGFKPGDVQFYQSGYNAQNGDLVSSKVAALGGDAAAKLYNGTIMVSSARTGDFRTPGYEPNEYSEMCNREYQAAGGAKYSATDTETNSAYGATVGMCSFIRLIARALEKAGPNPTRADLAAAVGALGAIDLGGDVPGSFGPDKFTAPNVLNKVKWNYPCAAENKPFGDPPICIMPEGDSFPIPAG